MSYREVPVDRSAERACTHGVTFDREATANMSSHDIRQKWPRLVGDCPLGCGFRGIAYASGAHYVFGDW